jgi:hypothetical protein
MLLFKLIFFVFSAGKPLRHPEENSPLLHCLLPQIIGFYQYFWSFRFCVLAFVAFTFHSRFTVVFGVVFVLVVGEDRSIQHIVLEKAIGA